MPICKIAHGIKTERGFKIFEVGVDYPASEIGDRGKYFEKEPVKQPEPEIKRPSKRTEKITEEVTDNAG